MQPYQNKSPNRMTLLLNKIERRLTLGLRLPEELSKDSWVQIIEEDTIPEFSRYFPHKIVTIIDNNCCKDGYYFVDKNLPEGSVIIGVKDIDWEAYRCDPRYDRYGINFGTYDFISRDYAVDDVAFSQMSADFMSLFNLGIYIDFEYPNKIKLQSVNGSPVSRYRPFPLAVFVQHPSNLMTISPTMMKEFEDLATSDVANVLYENLKWYDGTDTVYQNLDLKLQGIENWKNKRDEIIQRLDEAHTTTANENQPIILTV